MAVAKSTSEGNRWREAVLGPLPEDFLRVSAPANGQEMSAGPHPALITYPRQPMTNYMASNSMGRLSITCAQARLVRNYGLTRMDPYVRIRVGHYVYETLTDPNGGKNPRWNRAIHTQLPPGVNSIYIEVFDECSFKMDELIAWCEIKIPESVLRGETHEEWYPLSGKQGEGLEGAIDIVLSFVGSSFPPYIYQQGLPSPNPLIAAASSIIQPGSRAVPIYIAAAQPTNAGNPVANQMPVPPPQLTESDMKQIKEMFPNIETDVVKTVFEANRGNKDATINSLLQMNE